MVYFHVFFGNLSSLLLSDPAGPGRLPRAWHDGSGSSPAGGARISRLAATEFSQLATFRVAFPRRP